jgi:hypothetical protein
MQRKELQLPGLQRLAEALCTLVCASDSSEFRRVGNIEKSSRCMTPAQVLDGVSPVDGRGGEDRIPEFQSLFSDLNSE